MGKIKRNIVCGDNLSYLFEKLTANRNNLDYYRIC